MKNLFSRITILLAFAATAFGEIQAQSYLWPTNASQLMTSSFCEFRPRHYHAALDIKTWNRTGYKIYAIDDGYIMRVRVSAYGYGKATYLKLKDGRIVVFGHQSRFNTKLEKYVDAYRLANHQYRADLYFKPDQFPVHRGDIIGYTGRTGIGVPHLHFELRNSHNEPINPLQFYRNTIKDDIAPLLYGAAFIPMDMGATVNQSTDTLLLNFKPSAKVALRDTLIFSGKIGVALKTYDHADGATNRFTFYKASLSIDDSVQYQVQYDKFSYGETRLVELDKNFSLWRKGEGIYHNFFLKPGNAMRNYGPTSTGGGILDIDKLNPGVHTLKVELQDYWNNRSEFSMVFRIGDILPLTPDTIKLTPEQRIVRFRSPQKLKKIMVKRRELSGKWHQVSFFRILDYNKDKDGGIYTVGIPVSKNLSGDLFRFQGVDEDGMPTAVFYVSGQDNPDSASSNPGIELMNYQIKKSWVEMNIVLKYPDSETIRKRLQVLLPGLLWTPEDYQTYRLSIPAETYHSERQFLEQLFSCDLQPIAIVNTKIPVGVLSADQMFAAHFPVDGLYEKTTAFIRSTSFSPGNDAIPAPYRSVGRIYDIEPFDQPVNSAIHITLKIPASAMNLKGLGLYYQNSRSGWNFMPASRDTVNGWFATNITSMEKFALIQDIVPPLLTPVQRVKGDTLISSKGNLSFIVKDEMSGVSGESKITVTVDNEWHLFEFDPEEDVVSLSLPKTKGTYHQLTLDIKDNAGNETTRTFWAK